MRPILKNDVNCTKVSSNSSIQADINERNEITIKSKLLAFHIVSGHRRMVADFFIVDRNAFDVTLECLSKNGVEGFLHE